jgi:hypothetical protein
MNDINRFQADKWFKNFTARHVWNQLRLCWINIYLDSLDLITSNANKQFIVRKFKQYALNMSIKMNIVSIKTHHSIDMIERYHDSLRKVYDIIIAKISNIDSNSTLQMTFKTLNDSVDSNDLILILLIFDVYLCIIEMNVSSSTIIQRFIAMRKAMKKIRKSIVIRQLNDALNIRNDSSSTLIRNLSINSDVLVYRERNDSQSESWKDSFKFLNVNDESIIIELSSHSIKFRSTMIKSYYDDDHFENSSLFISITDLSFIAFVSKSLNMSQSNDQFVVSIDQKSKFEIFSNSLKRVAIVLENISHRLYIWVSCSIRLMILISLSISFSLRLRYSISLSSSSSIRSYTSFFLNSQHSDKKRSTISSKRVFFNQ